MDPNRLTLKSQEAVQDAHDGAVRRGHPEVDCEHLLLALLAQSDGLLPRLLARMDISAEALIRSVDAELEGRPRVSGPGAEVGKVYTYRPCVPREPWRFSQLSRQDPLRLPEPKQCEPLRASPRVRGFDRRTCRRCVPRSDP